MSRIYQPSPEQVASLLELVRKAGEAILEVYRGEFDVEYKSDDSPLTRADQASHEILKHGLPEIFPDTPLLSEEGSGVEYDKRRGWEGFLLVDPLDGTKEFVKRNDEFTVNIGLVQGRETVFGMLHVPVLGQTYYGGRGMGAFKVSGGGEPEGIRTAPPAPGETLTAVSSRSHPSPDLQKILDRYNVGQSTPAGSAYKFCLVADGRAHLYARTNPTWEWDTAAGQAIVEAAGGAMARLDGGPFLYNKQDLRNPGFIVTGWVDSE